MTDEQLIVPVSPGSALVRLSQVKGALQRHSHIAEALPAATITQLQQEQETLLRALEVNEAASIQSGLRVAQEHLRSIYETLSQAHTPYANGTAAGQSHPCSILGFPDPRESQVQPVNAKTVIATFSKPARQVMTALSFQEAAGAIAYWLVEVRFLRDERLEDFMVESTAPLFTRLRLPCGPHTLRIQTRNLSEAVMSEDFTIEVPAL
ncbi:MAG: hypothetical protein JO316_06775 [Abitibacteriaceae bacterium]|nr:hypothetical protein [Abditibacteriaceae bacterium]MBV9865036.1 hypothetical protein [Abditibacteriaceae bacterium]